MIHVYIIRNSYSHGRYIILRDAMHTALMVTKSRHEVFRNSHFKLKYERPSLEQAFHVHLPLFVRDLHISILQDLLADPSIQFLKSFEAILDKKTHLCKDPKGSCRSTVPKAFCRSFSLAIDASNPLVS